GNESLTVRVLVATGRIPAAALAPGADWPALFDSYEEMAAAMGGRGEDRPMADEPTVPKGLTPAEIKIIVVAEGRDAGTWGEGDTLAAAMYESGRPRFYRAYLATPGTTADNRGPGRAMLCTPDHPPKEFHSNLPPAPPRAPAARGKAAGK